MKYIKPGLKKIQYTLFVNAYKTFSKIIHILDEVKLNKNQNINIIPHKIMLKNNNKKDNWKIQNILKFCNTHLNSPWVK